MGLIFPFSRVPPLYIFPLSFFVLFKLTFSLTFFYVTLIIDHKEATTILATKLPFSIAIATHTLKTMIITNRSNKPNQTKREKNFGFAKVA
jgi:hypothetical protein